MTKVILRGCNGQMGQVISSILKEDNESELVAGIDISGIQKNEYPVYKSFSECSVEADVIIDFSFPGNLEDMIEFAKNQSIGIVLCTTGFDEEQTKYIEDASKVIPILKSANMSMGVNLIEKLLKTAAPVLREAGFDIEIIEKHHRMKLDAPSGTALALADAMNEVLEPKHDYKYDRSLKKEARAENEIGIMALRGGTIIGEHEVVFAGLDEVIEIKHTAYSKAIFAKGSIQAAKYLVGKEAGMYGMNDVIE